MGYSIIKKINKRVSFLLCLCMIMTLFSACGKNKNQTGVTPTPAEPTATPVVTVSKPDTGSGFEVVGEYNSAYKSATLPQGMSTVKITADKALGAGSISADTSFTIETSGEVTTEEIQKNITILPTVEYSITRLSGTTYAIKPSSSLQSGCVYRFVIGDVSNPQNSFVFQTDSELVVKSFYPADLSVSVPVNTGIELTLSEILSDECNIEEYFTVEPAVSGEYHIYPDGKTIAFVPAEKLAMNTVYTITAKAGMKSISGKELKETVTRTFRTESETAETDFIGRISFSSRDLLFTTDDIPTFSYMSYVYSSDYSIVQDKVGLQIYRYASAEDAIKAMKEYEAVKGDVMYSGEEYMYSTDSLEHVGDYSIAPAEDTTGWNFKASVEMPSLPEGCYVVNVQLSMTVDGKSYKRTTQLMLQISDIVLYTESYDGTTLAWVNDKTGTPLAGAAVTIDAFSRNIYWNLDGKSEYSRMSGITDSDGIAMFTTGENNSAYVLVKTGDKSRYACVTTGSDITEHKYLSYFYTDRSVYFSDDVINFYGILTPANDETTLPSQLTLYTGWSDTVGSIVKVNADGTYKGSINVENYYSSYFYLHLCDEDGTTVSSSYLSVTQESKPVYKAEVTFDKMFYKRGDTVTVSVKAAFFDGTPVPGLKFSLYVSPFFSDSIQITTNSEGVAEYSFVTGTVAVWSTSAISIYAEATLIGEELTSLTASGNVPYFHSNVYFTASRIIPEDGTASYTEVRLNNVDLSHLLTQSDMQYPEYPDNTIGTPAEGTASIVLTKIEYVKNIYGTSYDPITKRTYENYSYDRVETIVKSYTQSFANGLIKLDHIAADSDFTGYYLYSISYTDPETGKTYEISSYAREGRYEQMRWYVRSGNEMVVEDGPFKIGDTVNCKISHNGEYTDEGVTLFTIYSNGMYSYKVVRGGSYSFIFTDDLVCGTYVYASWMCNGTVTQMGGTSVSYDYFQNEISDMTVSADKDTYKPGEEAIITVKVPGASAGKLLLSVVDEACFALGDNELDPLAYYSGLYSYIWPCRNSRFSAYYGAYEMYFNSIENTMMDTAAEDSSTGNGASVRGSDVSVRETFLDNPVFNEYSIGTDGTVVITLTVPDNITEWRLTAVAFADGGEALSDMKLGSAVSDIICTLPLFVNSNVCENYIEGDDIVISGRVYASALENGSQVEYICEIYDDNEKLIATMSEVAGAGEQKWFNFGKMSSGSYTAVVKAITPAGSDGVKTHFTITKSGILLNVRKNLSATELSTINPQMYPVTLSFYNKQYSEYLAVVDRLMRAYSTRYDSLAAYYTAMSASEELFGSSQYVNSELTEIKQKLSSFDSLIPVLEYGEGDLTVSAKICAVAPDSLTDNMKSVLISQFNAYLAMANYVDGEDLTAALFGLAALGEPVLNELNFVASCCGDFSLTAKLQLAAAFAYLGDFTSAMSIYSALKSEYAVVTEDGSMYFEGSNVEMNIKYTALALMTAAVICKSDAVLLKNYVMSHESTVDLYTIELAAYVKYFYPSESSEASFTYILNGEEKQITLDAYGIYYLTLDKNAFENFAVTSSDGSIGIRAAYYGSVEEALGENAETQKLKLTKTITPYDEARGLYLVTIEYKLTFDTTYECFALSDCIPSGFRYFSSMGDSVDKYSDSNYSYAYISNNGQNMSGYLCAYNSTANAVSGLSEKTVSGSLSYLIRKAAVGEFVEEAAVGQNRRTGAYAKSESSVITIE